MEHGAAGALCHPWSVAVRGGEGDFSTARALRAPAAPAPGPLRTPDRAALGTPVPAPSPARGRGRRVRPSDSRPDERQTTQDACSPGPGFLASSPRASTPDPAQTLSSVEDVDPASLPPTPDQTGLGPHAWGRPQRARHTSGDGRPPSQRPRTEASLSAQGQQTCLLLGSRPHPR